MNAAPFTAPRLQRCYAALREYGELSTLDLIRIANICAVNSVVAELRANGININCRRDKGRWLYSLTDPPDTRYKRMGEEMADSILSALGVKP